MARRSGLGVANGVATGVDSFVKSFIQTRQLKSQEKLQKNMIVVDLLMNQLRDDNTPYYQRAQIIDQIPSLIGAKLDRPLSNIIGYDKLNEEDFQVGTKRTAEELPSGGDPNDPEYRNKLMQSVAAANPEQIKETSITIKRGNLSPAQIKLQRDLETQRFTNQNDIDKQASILRINYELQSKILGKNGFNKEIFRGYNANGDYVITLANPQGETKDINLGPVQSEAVKKALIAGNKMTGRLGQLTTAQQVVAAYEEDPNSIPKANYDAAKNLIEDFERTGQLKDAQINSLNQNVSGTKPVTQAQNINNYQEDQKTQLALQTTLDTLEGEFAASEEAVALADAEVNGFYNVQIQPIKDRMKEWLDDGGEKEDKEYRDLQNQLRILTSQHEVLKSKFNATKTRKTSIERRRDAAAKRLRGFTPATGAATNTNSSVDDEVSQYKNLIDAFRSSNAEKTKNISDRQILGILKNAGRIPK